MFKITFNLKSPISFIDRPVFDAILAYCFVKDRFGFVPHKLSLSEEELINFDILPIKKHKKGYFITSYMQYDKEKAINYTDSWKKRWCNKFDFLADFGKNKRQIEIDKGRFKSYDMPLNVWLIDKVWFFFDPDNIKEVEKLIDKHLYGLGKKTSQGYGIIESKIIEEVDYNPFEKVIRPIPLRFLNLSENEKSKLIINGEIKFTGWRPPYWESKFYEPCAVGIN